MRALSQGGGVRWWLGLCVLLAAAATRADQGNEGASLALTVDNDAVFDVDRHYTHGARLTYWSQDEAMPGWLLRLAQRVPAPGFKERAHKLGFEVGQEIYTPADLDRKDLIVEDRPYAGWLYASVALQRRGPTARGLGVMETLRLDLGVVGPASLAEEAQRVTHPDQPRGWGNQLRNEPGFALRYERAYLLARRWTAGWGLDFIPRARLSGGTVDTSAGAGTLMRFGLHVPNEFEVADGRTEKKFGVYVFGGAEARYVVRNEFLDGSVWRSSHDVAKERWLSELKTGLTLVLKSIELTAAFTWRTREFKLQEEADRFGSATVRFKF